MDHRADIAEDWDAALAALVWYHELGVTEAIGDNPVNAFELPERQVAAVVPKAAQEAPTARPDRGDKFTYEADDLREVTGARPREPAVAVAVAAAARAGSLEALREALAAYDHCESKRGARNLVFADGVAGARVLILGEAPGRDEDMEGRPFAGRAGQLLDRMFAAIGLSRGARGPGGLYLTNAMPWRPPADREPTPEEIAMMRPFVARHIALARPDVIVAMGNAACAALLGTTGILRLRGTWTEALGVPVLPMAHPAYLLRNPAAKREAWADLLALQAGLRGMG